MSVGDRQPQLVVDSAGFPRNDHLSTSAHLARSLLSSSHSNRIAITSQSHRNHIAITQQSHSNHIVVLLSSSAAIVYTRYSPENHPILTRYSPDTHPILTRYSGAVYVAALDEVMQPELAEKDVALLNVVGSRCANASLPLPFFLMLTKADQANTAFLARSPICTRKGRGNREQQASLLTGAAAPRLRRARCS